MSGYIIGQVSEVLAQPQQNPVSGQLEVEGDCGKKYLISYSITQGATVTQMTADMGTFSTTFQLGSNQTEVGPPPPATTPSSSESGGSSNGTLTVSLPEALIGKDREPVLFIDGESSVDPKIINSTDDYVTLTVDFPSGTEKIEIYGSFIIAEGPYYRNLDVVAEGRHFSLIWDNAPVCNFLFDIDAKKITIHSDNATGFRIIIPNELLGPPYTTIVDGVKYQRVDTEAIYGSYNRNFTAISATFERGANATLINDIEIIGTTVIPEFGAAAAVALIVVMGTLVGGSLLLRYRVK